MSKSEDLLANIFTSNKIVFKTQIPVPIIDYPWKTKKSRTSPKCDFFIPEYNLYIEVKGFMTIEAMAKMKYLSKQKFNYYIFQCTESDWDPFIGNLVTHNNRNSKDFKNKTTQLKINISEQIIELCSNNKKYLSNISTITESRLDDFIMKKVNQYVNWNGVWI